MCWRIVNKSNGRVQTLTTHFMANCVYRLSLFDLDSFKSNKTCYSVDHYSPPFSLSGISNDLDLELRISAIMDPCLLDNNSRNNRNYYERWNWKGLKCYWKKEANRTLLQPTPYYYHHMQIFNVDFSRNLHNVYIIIGQNNSKHQDAVNILTKQQRIWLWRGIFGVNISMSSTVIICFEKGFCVLQVKGPFECRKGSESQKKWLFFLI